MEGEPESDFMPETVRRRSRPRACHRQQLVKRTLPSLASERFRQGIWEEWLKPLDKLPLSFGNLLLMVGGILNIFLWEIFLSSRELVA